MGTAYKSRFISGRCKKYLSPSAFPKWGSSEAEQSTEHYKEGKAWEDSPLTPSIQKTSNHPARMPGGLPEGKGIVGKLVMMINFLLNIVYYL